MRDIALTYVHDCYPGTGPVGCSRAGGLVFRVISSHDSAYERPTLYCKETNNELKLVSINGKKI